MSSVNYYMIHIIPIFLKRKFVVKIESCTCNYYTYVYQRECESIFRKYFMVYTYIHKRAI